MEAPHNFILSNSKMRAWEIMCPLEFKAKYIDQSPLYEWKESDAMHYGNVFESMVIGKGIHGFVKPNEKLEKSTLMLDRLKKNAILCRQFLRDFGGKIKGVQKHIATTVSDAQGRTIYIEGTLDILYQFEGGKWAIIDLKFTGDNTSDFGQYQFGDEEKLDPTQAFMYVLLVKLTMKEDAEWFFWVFDKKKESVPKIIQVEIDDTTLTNHIERISKAYHEILDCLTNDSFKPQPKYSRCAKCKVKCSEERKIPDIITIKR